MKSAWLACLLFSSILGAGTQDPEFNVNSRYTVESVEVTGDGWSTNVTSDPDRRISPSLRKQMAGLIGNKLDPGILDDLAARLRQEFKARAVTHHVLRGASPEYVKVAYQIQLRSTRFDVAVPKFLYSSANSWSGAVEGTATLGHNGFTLGLVSDGDVLAERYTGLLARYENTRLGSDRVRLRVQFETYHDQWNSASGTEGLYRARQNFEPVLTFTLARPLTLSVGASLQSFEMQSPGAPTESANAVITTLQYHRRMDDSEYQQEVNTDYNLRAASKSLASDFAYTRHRWNFLYLLKHGKHQVSDELTGGVIAGHAPLVERFILGNSTTLRGWSKYEIDPVGGNRMVHNSVEYRYGSLQFFYDAGAVWEGGQPVVVRHSIGTGLHQGPLFVAIAFPLHEGRADPIFMVGMNY
jgi:hypothetical protein